MWTAPPLTPPFHIRSVAAQNRRERESVDVAVKSDGKIAKSMPNTKQQASKEREEEDEKQQLSGSAILMALERATAQKSKKQREKKRDFSVTRVRKTGDADFVNNVRPLCIKPDWSERLQDLEKRLEDLIHG